MLAPVFALLVGCSESEGELPQRQARTSAEQEALAPPAATVGPSCVPDLYGLVPAGIDPIEIRCPDGYVQRKSFAALPLTGRFTTAMELVEAFCAPAGSPVASAVAAADLDTATSIDFEQNDVVAYAFDARAGVEPALFAHGYDLWLRVTNDMCSGRPPELASIAFVVPKGKRVKEQTCALTCP